MHRLAHNIHYRGASRSSREASRRPRVPPTRRHAPASVPARIPRGRPRTRRGTAAGSRPPARPSPRGRFPRRASPRLAVPGRRRACRRGSRGAADPEACTMDGHGDPPVGRGASAPPCRDGTIPAHGRSPLGPQPGVSSTPSVRVISSRALGRRARGRRGFRVRLFGRLAVVRLDGLGLLPLWAALWAL